MIWCWLWCTNFLNPLNTDNVIFQLSNAGFFGTSNLGAARIVTETDYIVRKSAKHNPWFLILLMAASFFAMLGIMVVVIVNQINGAFLPQNIIIQWSDDLSTFSSAFELQINNHAFSKSRVVYKSKTGNTVIGFCNSLKAWTIGAEDRTDFCDDIMALSSNPTNLDITNILGKQWFIQINNDGYNRLLPLSNVYSAKGCSSDLACGGVGRGTCDTGSCVCEPGFFGLRCHYDESKVCSHIRVNELTDEFTGLRRRVSAEYTVLQNEDTGAIVTAYEHPVYAEPGASQKGPNEIVDALIYVGLRWVLTSVAVPADGRLDLLFSNFYASKEVLGPIEATTEHVRFDTKTDEIPAPIDLQWLLPGSDEILEMNPILSINTVLLCTDCAIDSNSCSNNNPCDEVTSTCTCKHGEKGSLCQVIPLGDGRCDLFFNRIEFE